jgi:nitrile hydratase accessory protein
MSRPEPAFEAPWHAQVFAVTVALHDAGHFTWPDWAERLGAALRSHGLGRDLNGGDDYFAAWLDALESLLAQKGLAETETLAALTAAWRAAYLSTPQGAPVHLGS